ncbi:MAG: HEAT repeat domain-containing protein, partial [Lysobacterales bacterium]
MNARWLAVLVTLLGSTAWAQVGELYNAEVTHYTRSDDPAEVAGKVEDGWLAFPMPVLEGTRSPCCWSGRWTTSGEPGCKLATRYTHYGSRSDSPLTDSVIVYARLRSGQVQKLRVFGEQCPVDGNGEKIMWLDNADQNDALAWLGSVAGFSRGDGAMYALALHASDGATRRLLALARDSDRDTASEAVFWLGEARGKQGFEALESLLDELPLGKTRREIAFGLAMNDSAEAAALLGAISRDDKDPELRGQALFWLAQEYPVETETLLLEAVRGERDEEVLDEAIFAISQLPGKSGSRMLLDIARDA